MKEYSIKVKSFDHISIEDAEGFILRKYPSITKINYRQEALFPDILEDGTIIYVYYFVVESEDE
jgi:hypothetical protein